MSKVWVILSGTPYEGENIISIHESEKSARSKSVEWIETYTEVTHNNWEDKWGYCRFIEEWDVLE